MEYSVVNNTEEEGCGKSKRILGWEKLLYQDYGPMIEILGYLETSELLNTVKLVSKYFRRICFVVLEFRKWNLKELYEINIHVRKNYQKWNLLYPKKVRFFDEGIKSVFGAESLKKVFIFYEDEISSDFQKRMFPLYISPRCSVELVKMLFVLIYGNYPVRSGTELDADLYYKRCNSFIPPSGTDIGRYTDFFKSNVKWGEILQFSDNSDYSGDLENARKIKDFLRTSGFEYPVLFCKVRGIILWGEMYSYSPTYRPYNNNSSPDRIRVHTRRTRELWSDNNQFINIMNREEVFRLVRNRELYIHYLENVPNEMDDNMTMKYSKYSKNNNIGKLDFHWNKNPLWKSNLDFSSVYNESLINKDIFICLYEILKNRNFIVHRAMG